MELLLFRTSLPDFHTLDKHIAAVSAGMQFRSEPEVEACPPNCQQPWNSKYQRKCNSEHAALAKCLIFDMTQNDEQENSETEENSVTEENDETEENSEIQEQSETDESSVNQESSEKEEARGKIEDTKDEQVIENAVDSADLHEEAFLAQDDHCTAVGLMQPMEARMMQSMEDMFQKYLRA